MDYIHTDGRVLHLGLRPTLSGTPKLQWAKIHSPILPPAPADFDSREIIKQKYSIASWPTGVYGNDAVGDCVVAWLINALKLQIISQTGIVFNPTTDEAKKWYFGLTGNQDIGLDPIATSRALRKDGAIAGEKLRKIFAYASVDPASLEDIKQLAYYLLSAGLEIALPRSAQAQVGSLWTLTQGPDAYPGSWGYHMVDAPRFKSNGNIVCETWGADQEMTPEWFAAYVFAAIGLVPSPDTLDPVISPVDVDKLTSELAILSELPDEPTITSVVPDIGIQGARVPVQILGTGYSVDSDVSAGEDIIIENMKAVSYNELDCEFVIGQDAKTGDMPVTVNVAGKFGVLDPGFKIEPPDPPPPPVPPPSPSPCKWGKATAAVLNIIFLQKLRGRKGRFCYMNPGRTD